MTLVSKKKRSSPRRKWLPILTTGIFGLHLVVFLLLAQCGSVGPGYRHQVSYISLPSSAEKEEVFELKEPPRRMFYRFASMPLVAEEEELHPLSGPRWSGYETMVALRTEKVTPLENYRLTMDFIPPARKKRPPNSQAIFRTVVVQGVPMQPVSPVPEPGTSVLFGLAMIRLLSLRQRY